MEIKYIIIYGDKVVEEDIPALDKKSKTLIKKAIEEKLITYPEIFGKPLRSSLVGYRKLRVGNYRIIFDVQKEKIIIWMIAHRNKIYEHFLKRMK